MGFTTARPVVCWVGLEPENHSTNWGSCLTLALAGSVSWLN